MRMRLVAIFVAVLLPLGMSSQASSTGSPEDREPGVAMFEGRRIDLRDGWGEAEACADWGRSQTIECFRSEEELLQRAAELGMTGQGNTLLASSSSTCPSALRLYDGLSYTSSVLYLYKRTIWINLSDYGWSNRTSSYKVGACPSYFADYSDGGGSWYPTNLTDAWDSYSSMVSGWNNRVSSIYIN